MLTSFACVKFMPVSDAITLIFTAPLFTMVIAAMFMRERITVIKAIAGKFTKVKWQPRYVFIKLEKEVLLKKKIFLYDSRSHSDGWHRACN